MTDHATGPVATEMTRRLEAALQPTRMMLHNDSDKHVGHVGHDGSGESHFTVVIESPRFEGLNRVARQRLVYQALGELMHRQVHALQIKASAPGEE